MTAFQQGTIHIKQKSTTQDNADAGWLRVYAKNDGSIYVKDSSGNDNKLAFTSDISGGSSWVPLEGQGMTVSVSGSDYVFATSSEIYTKLLVMRAMVDISTIPSGAKKIFIQVPFSGTITKWRLISDVATITTVDIWKANNSLPTVANTITASAKPALSSATVASSTTLTGWTTSVTAGDIFEMNIDSNSASAVLNLELEIEVA